MPPTLANQRIQNPATGISYRLMADADSWRITRSSPVGSVVALAALFNGMNDKRGPDAKHLHPHLFRHSIAVHLLRGGADLRHIQAFLGHSSLNTTKIYLRMVPGRLKEEYEKAMPEIAVGLDGGGLAAPAPAPTVPP